MKKRSRRLQRSLLPVLILILFSSAMCVLLPLLLRVSPWPSALLVVLQIILGLWLLLSPVRMRAERVCSICRTMEAVQRGNLQARSTVRGEDEIGVIAGDLNGMLSAIDTIIERDCRMPLRRREAEYRELQAEIHPEFLQQTFQAILGMNRRGERDALEKAVTALNGMLKHTLEAGAETSLRSEFLQLERYLTLQKIRMEERLDYTLSLGAGTGDLAIPKLLVLPLVENAVVHGIQPKTGSGRLIISAELEREPAGAREARMRENETRTLEKETRTRENEPRTCKAASPACSFVVIRVVDDGTGFIPEAVPEAKKAGLKSVTERIATTYAGATFELVSRPGEGTTTLLRIPLQEAGCSCNR